MVGQTATQEFIQAEAMNEAYEEQAARIGARSHTRTWRFKLIVFAIFVASITVAPGLLWLLK